MTNDMVKFMSKETDIYYFAIKSFYINISFSNKL